MISDRPPETRVVFPRLSQAKAVELLQDYSGRPPAELLSNSSTLLTQAFWYPTAALRASEPILQNLQKSMRECAVEFGYPGTTGTKSAQLTQFDRSAGRILFEKMPIVPADAASDDVWSFISLVVLPDVAFWRFPNRDKKPHYERILGRSRNVFRRLWWRTFTVGEELGAFLLEDEATAIMERPSLGGNPRIATAMARTHMEWVSSTSRERLPRTEVLREVAKRVLRLSMVATLSSLDDTELKDTMSAEFAKVTEFLSKSKD